MYVGERNRNVALLQIYDFSRMYTYAGVAFAPKVDGLGVMEAAAD